jgi:LacI family transcriptional regulator
MPITIHNVAKKLGLSITTVSRALDGYDDVADRTRARVIRTAHELGYVPSRAARQLRRQRADVIGYILPASGSQFTDPFFSLFIAGLGDEATSHNFDLLVSTAAPGGAAEKKIYARWIQSRLVDGIVLNRMRVRDWRAKYLVQHNFPFVAHGHTHLQLSFPYIEMDSRSVFILLVEHLVERGHRRIAYIGGPRNVTLQADRFAGYQEGLTRTGLPFNTSYVLEGDLTRNGGYLAAQHLLALPEPPTAIIGANDMSAIGAMRAAHERGLVVGRDLAVAGYDGTEDSEHTQPPLTTLKQPTYDTARRLVRMLIARIDGKDLSEPHVIIQPELIVRASTGG